MKSQNRFVTYVLILGFIFGLILKWQALFYPGVSDMKSYYKWGQESVERGVARSYHGTYYPFQYEIFQISAWYTSAFQVDYVPVFKFVNLIFDIGTFFLLLLILKQWSLNPIYSLIYWLHPWFLGMFSLGYIDFQFTFFVVLTIAVLRGNTVQDFVLAGLPLSLAFLMKPQALVLMIAFFLYGFWRFVRTRNLAPFAAFVFPLIFFCLYNTYFTVALFPRYSVAAAWKLPYHYLNIANVSPSLTAHMPNIWYLPAYLLRQPDQPIYMVNDQIPMLPFRLRHIAGLTVLLLIAFQIRKMEKAEGVQERLKLAIIFTFATLTLTFIEIGAHENHLFLGTVLLILFLGKDYPLSFKIAVHVLLIAQFLNLYGIYGENPVSIARFLKSNYSYGLSVVYSFFCVPAYIVIAKNLWSPRERALKANPETV